jgi:hypothetical protein
VTVTTDKHCCVLEHSSPFGHGIAQYESPPSWAHTPPPVQSESITHGGHATPASLPWPLLFEQAATRRSAKRDRRNIDQQCPLFRATIKVD